MARDWKSVRDSTTRARDVRASRDASRARGASRVIAVMERRERERGAASARAERDARERCESWVRALIGEESALERANRRAAYERDRVVALGDLWATVGTENVASDASDEGKRSVAMDVERLAPGDDAKARAPECVDALKRILVTHAMRSRRGYRQGMHEVAATVLEARTHAADYSRAPAGTGRWGDGTMDEATAFASSSHDDPTAGSKDYRFVEHDAFAMFEALMGDADVSRADDDGRVRLAAYYEDASTPTSPISAAFRRIVNALHAMDSVLARKLEELEVEPQLYLLRWLRLGFGREFHRTDTLALWDAIFESLLGITAHGDKISSRDVYEGVAVSVLMSMRNDLLDADDFGTAMSRLQRVPPGIQISHMIARATAMAVTGVLRDDGFKTHSARKPPRQTTPSMNRLVVPSIRGKSPSQHDRGLSRESLGVEASSSANDDEYQTGEDSSLVDLDENASLSDEGSRKETTETPTLLVPPPVTMRRVGSRRDAADSTPADAADPFTAPIFTPATRESEPPPPSVSSDARARLLEETARLESDVAASRAQARRHLHAALDALSRAMISGDQSATIAARQIDTALERLL